MPCVPWRMHQANWTIEKWEKKQICTEYRQFLIEVAQKLWNWYVQAFLNSLIGRCTCFRFQVMEPSTKDEGIKSWETKRLPHPHNELHQLGNELWSHQVSKVCPSMWHSRAAIVVQKVLLCRWTHQPHHRNRAHAPQRNT